MVYILEDKKLEKYATERVSGSNVSMDMIKNIQLHNGALPSHLEESVFYSILSPKSFYIGDIDSDDFDNVDYLEKMLPWAVGMSYRNQPTEELTAKMIKLSQDGGYKGWYGIESSGREAILQGKQLLKKYLEI